MSIESIETQIVSILNTVTEFKKVYEYEPLEIKALPAASIFYEGFAASDEEGPLSQEVHEKWILRVYLRLDDAKAAQTQMKTIIPKVRKAFRENRQLNGQCIYNQLYEGNIFAVMDKNNAQLIAELHLSAVLEEF